MRLRNNPPCGRAFRTMTTGTVQIQIEIKWWFNKRAVEISCICKKTRKDRGTQENVSRCIHGDGIGGRHFVTLSRSYSKVEGKNEGGVTRRNKQNFANPSLAPQLLLAIGNKFFPRDCEKRSAMVSHNTLRSLLSLLRE